MLFSQFDDLFPPRQNLRSGAEVVSLCLRAQPYLALQDGLGVLIAYALAHRTGGSFIVHLDDTDPDSLQEKIPYQIFNLLSWLDISPDELLDLGEYGPYTWRERRHIYQEVAMYLVEQGWAYHCFCQSQHEVDSPVSLRRSVPHQGCRTLPFEQVCDRLLAGERYLLRFSVRSDPVPGADQSDDLEAFEDFPLLTPDGLPMPYFAHVVDNHFMRTTIQVRRSSTRSMIPKEILLYQALGWDMPCQLYVPEIHDSEVHYLFEESQIDKFLAQGYLPEALVNTLTNLVWPHPQKRVIYPYADFVKYFKNDMPLPEETAIDYKLLNRIQKWYAMNKL